MIRFPATGQKIGSLVINPGGPGESGIEAAISMVESLPTPVRERFDFVGFDPRGVGSSTPALWCNSDADNDRLRADPEVDYTPEGVAHIENETKAFIQRCVDKMGPEFLANIGTANVAKDLDADPRRDRRRQAHLPRLLLRHPDRRGLRRGVPAERARDDSRRGRRPERRSDPGRPRPGGRPSRRRSTTSPPTAPKSFDCPLGTDPSKSVAVYRSMVDPLVDKPAKTKDPRGLSYSDAIVGTIMALYSPTLWRHLTDGLVELRAGRGDTLLALADMYMRRDQQGHYTNATDARVAVNCVDQPAITDRAKVIEEDRQMREGGAVHELRRVHRPRADAHLRVLAGPADQPAAPDLGHRACRRRWWSPPRNDPATPYPGRRRPGQAARRRAADLRGHPAHRCVPGQQVH